MSPNFTSTILVILSVFTLNIFSANSQVTYTVNGNSNTTYHLNSSDSLIINAGTYTGSITSWNAGSVILVKSGSTFAPNSYGNHVSKLIVNGTATIKNLSALNGFSLENYGNTTFDGGWQQLTGNSKINNYFGGVVNFTGNMTLNSSSNEIVNQGDVTVVSNLTFNGGSKINNRKSVIAGGDIVFNNGASLSNLGKFQATNITFNSSSTMNNGCRFIAAGEITLNQSTITNTGLIWSSNANNNSKITINNGGNLNLSGNGTIKSVTFTNSGTITGSGNMYFTGVTTANGTVGSATGSGNMINVFDATRTNSARIFDTQGAGVNTNTVQFANVTAPDTLNTLATCAPEEAPLPLPVKWESFNVNLTNNVPVLDWKASFDYETNFEIQRSYDGITFTTIAVVLSVNNIRSYQYKDAQVNSNSKIVYYRINGKEITGEAKLSDTRTVRFSNTKNVSLQVIPNPFVSQLQVQYQATEKETITIRVINTSGQALVTKNVGVNNGFNSIAVTEAGSFVKGVYFLQVISNNKIIATEKVVKQ
jgi:hypothetical protein